MEYTYSPDVIFSYILIGSIVVALLIAIPLYLLYAIGLKTIADRRNLKHSIFAFFPFFGSYLLGCVYDDMQALKGKKTGYRKLLLAFSLCMGIPMMLYFTIYILGMSYLFSNTMYDPFMNDTAGASFFLVFLLAGMLYVIGLGFGIAYAVFYYIALYNIYNEYDRKNTVLYLVLSIVFGFSWLFLFLIRNKEPVPFFPETYAPPYGYPQPPYPGQPQPPYGYVPPVPGPQGPGMYPPPAGAAPQYPSYGRPSGYPQAPYPGYPQPPVTPPVAPMQQSVSPAPEIAAPAEILQEESDEINNTGNNTGEEPKDV